MDSAYNCCPHFSPVKAIGRVAKRRPLLKKAHYISTRVHPKAFGRLQGQLEGSGSMLCLVDTKHCTSPQTHDLGKTFISARQWPRALRIYFCILTMIPIMKGKAMRGVNNFYRLCILMDGSIPSYTCPFTVSLSKTQNLIGSKTSLACAYDCVSLQSTVGKGALKTQAISSL